MNGTQFDSKAGNVLVFESAEDVARAGAERFVTLAGEAISAHDLFSVALAGGSTPRRMYELLATESFRGRVHWARVHFFFGDERCVPPDHPESNYRMANDSLISRLEIPRDNIHPINGQGDPNANAKLYEAELRSYFPALEWPRFDLVLLGMGEDGHTASLFPLTNALNEKQAWVVGNWVEKLGTHRITLTAPTINGAGNIIFLVTGANKAAALAEVITGPPDPQRLPAQLIKSESGSLTWLVDVEAASNLARRSSDRN